MQAAFGKHIHQVVCPHRFQHGPVVGPGLGVVGHVHHIERRLGSVQQAAEYFLVVLVGEGKRLPVHGHEQATGRKFVPAHRGHHQQRQRGLAQHVHHHAGEQLGGFRRVAGPGQHHKQRVVAAHGLGQGGGQETLRHVHFGGHGLVGSQLQQGPVGLLLAAQAVSTVKAFRHGQAIVAHMQQHQLRMERHGQSRRIREGAVSNGEKIGQDNKSRHHDEEGER